MMSHQKSRGRHLPLGSDPGLSIALEAAPEHFFDQDRWNEFVLNCGGRERALSRISHPDPAELIRLRLEVARGQNSDAAKARETDRIHRLGQSLVKDFRKQLISDEYIATGLQPPSIERMTIPAELHRELIFNFEDGVAKGGGYTFTHVCIVKSMNASRQESDVSPLITVWLVERQALHGEELKKTLLNAAYHEFGGECTTRAFDAAYRRVYVRKRGRPPISRRQ